MSGASLAQRLAAMPAEERQELFEAYPEEIRRAIERDWRLWARPEQLPPRGDWRIWLILAGRGWGKSRTGAEWVQSMHQHYRRIHLVGRTAGDVRDVMVEGPSGICTIAPAQGRPTYHPSMRRLVWPNGAVAITFSSDEPEALRGPQCGAFWADELAAWRNLDECWTQLLMGFRLGTTPRGIITTTPKPHKLLKRLLADPTTAVVRGRTHDNIANLAAPFIDQIIRPYEGTRLGRQELEGEIVEDLEGALWSSARIHELRVEEAPELERVVVGIDPGTGTGEDAGETGIVVAGRGRDGHAYVLSDKSLRASPDAWARQAIVAYHQYHADRIIAERNQGGDMVEHTLRTVDPAMPFKAVTASRGKATRAEPIAALYEQGKVHHVGAHARLEDQMCSWVPGMTSPDRMDACLVAGTGVLTERGLVAIECVNVGDRVLTRRGYRSVTWAGMTHRVAHTLTVEFSNAAVLRGTAEHPVWVRGHGWMPLGELRQGDLVQACDYVAPVYVARSYANSAAPVYNLHIDGVHEFYANGILVHNCVWALTELMLGHASLAITGPWDTTFGRRVNPWRA